MAGKREEQMKEITDRLEQGVQELFTSERYTEYLQTMSKFYNYSFNNTLLIAMQKPDATLVAGYQAWQKKFDRHVLKGEKGIQIIAPAPIREKQEMEKIDPNTQEPVLRADGQPEVEEIEIVIPRFRVTTVFDVSQTDGKPLPEIGVEQLTASVNNYETFMQAIADISPVPIRFDEIEGDANGYYHNVDKEIVIQSGMSESQTMKTAIHETAHANLHDKEIMESVGVEKNKLTKEVEAESVAFTVCYHFGLDTSDYSFPYIAGWSSSTEQKELKESMDTIRKTSATLIDAIEDRMAELNLAKAQEMEQRKISLILADEQAHTYTYPFAVVSVDIQEMGGDRTAVFKATNVDVENAMLSLHNAFHGLDLEKAMEEEYGVEWVESIDFDDGYIITPEIERTQVERTEEEILLSGSENRFGIYQLKAGDDLHYHRFEGLDRLESHGLQVEKNNYELIYTAPLLEGQTLDGIYEQFNLSHPEDFTGHSLSVSDIVLIHQDGENVAQYVDSFGFAEIPTFLEQVNEEIKEQGLEVDSDAVQNAEMNADDMAYEQFLHSVKEDIEKEISENYEKVNVTILNVEKPGNDSYRGIQIRVDDNRAGICLNLTPFFEEMKAGMDYAEILENVIQIATQTEDMIPHLNVDEWTDYEQMKGYMQMELVNSETIRNVANDLVHKDYGDMSLIYRIVRDDDEVGAANALVTKGLLKEFGITEDQLHSDVASQSAERYPISIKTLTETVADIVGIEFEENEVGENEAGELMYVVGNQRYSRTGAAVLGYPDFLDNIAERMDGDYFILPSSVHELMIVPDYEIFEPEELRELVKASNNELWSEDEWLSDQVYHYDSLEHVFELAEDFVARKAEHNRMNENQPEPELIGEELAWKVRNYGYMALQTTEGGYDYTLYDSNFHELDGGVLENPDFTMKEARNEILQSEGLGTRALTAFDYEELMEQVEEAAIIPVKPPEVHESELISNNTEPELGLNGMSRASIEETALCYAQAQLDEAGMDDIKILGARVYGSRSREGLYKEHSDIDVVLSYTGDISEDSFFHLVHEDGMFISGMTLDINPISAEKTCSLEEYMEKAEKYLDKKELEQSAVGKVTYASGETMFYTDKDEYLKVINEEFIYWDTTGFRFETLSDDPELNKAVDDIVFDYAGGENLHDMNYYLNKQNQMKKEKIVSSLATDIDEFGKGFDPYEYADVVDNREEAVEGLKKDLLEGHTKYMEEWIQGIIDEKNAPEETLDEAKGVLERLQKFSKGQELENPIIGRVSFANGEEFTYTDKDEFLKCIDEEIEYRATSGFHYDVLTDDPEICKAVDDRIYNLIGEYNPYDLEHYQNIQKEKQSQQQNPTEIAKEPAMVETAPTEEKATISFYVAECMEFTVLGEYHDNLTLPEAVELYKKIPAERMNGIKGIGFNLQDGSWYDGDIGVLFNGRLDIDFVNDIQHYRESPLVQQALKEIKAVVENGMEYPSENIEKEEKPLGKKDSVLKALRERQQKLKDQTKDVKQPQTQKKKRGEQEL